MKVKKAIIPAAGMGTRVLPASKASSMPFCHYYINLGLNQI